MPDPNAGSRGHMRMVRVDVPFKEARKDFEKQYLDELLTFTGGNVTEAADLAEKDRKDFYSLMKRNDVDPNVYRWKPTRG